MSGQFSSSRPLAVTGDLPEGRLQGRQLFADLVAQALSTGAAQGWNRVVLGERLEQWWGKGSPSFPAVTLGL